MKTRQIVIVGSVFVLFGGSAFFASIASKFKEETPEKKVAEVKRYVKNTPVRYEDVATEVIAYGRVQTAESLDLIAEVSGRMTQGTIQLKAGESFNKGTLIYKIDDTEAKLNLQAQKSNFLRDLAAILPDLKIDYSDSYPKWENYFNSIEIEKSLPEIPKTSDSKEKTFLATKNIYNSYYTIKSAEANLRKFRFYAPFSGSISMVNLQSGSFVNPGGNIGKILKTSSLELKVSVETKEVPWIRKGSEVMVSSDDQNSAWMGYITRIGDYVNQNTQSVDVFISVVTEGRRLYDGQYLQATIPAEKIENGMIIPRNAIYNSNEVFVLRDSVLKTRNINILKTNPETVVFDGLEPGSDLVVEPLINAHNNMKAFKLESSNTEVELEGEISSGSDQISSK